MTTMAGIIFMNISDHEKDYGIRKVFAWYEYMNISSSYLLTSTIISSLNKGAVSSQYPKNVTVRTLFFLKY